MQFTQQEAYSACGRATVKSESYRLVASLVCKGDKGRRVGLGSVGDENFEWAAYIIIYISPYIRRNQPQTRRTMSFRLNIGTLLYVM